MDVPTSTTGGSSSMHPEKTSTPSRTPSLTKPSEGHLAHIMSNSFQPFDAQTLVIQPFQEEDALDSKYEMEISKELLKTLLITHAWAAARHKHEVSRESQKLEAEVSHIQEVEQEQGTSRLQESSRLSPSLSVLHVGVLEKLRARLAAFVRKMQTAIAALADSEMML